MSANTAIEWAHHTVNFWWGCAKVSPACQHCYAEAWAKYASKARATWGVTGSRWLRHMRAHEEMFALDRAAGIRGVRERVFVNSMSDTFEDRTDLNAARRLLWNACNHVRNIDVLLLTKRPENVRELVPMSWIWGEWPAHVWVGTTVENQAMAEARIPALLNVPARVRFLSCEPMLERIDLAYACFNGADSLGAMPGIDWVIIGGESGPGARDFDVEAAWDLSLQCRKARVPVFVKQLGARPVTGNANAMDWPDETEFLEHGEGAASARVKLRDAKGGDIDEFPAELQVREFPGDGAP